MLVTYEIFALTLTLTLTLTQATKLVPTRYSR